MIDVNEIAAGDQVCLIDIAANKARGTVIRRGVMLAITAFGVPIEFARVTSGGKVVVQSPVRVVEHTPSLVGGAA